MSETDAALATESDQAEERHARLVLRMKHGDPISIEGQHAAALHNEICQHVRQHGFGGWRIVGGVVLNMAELQAAYLMEGDDHDRD